MIGTDLNLDLPSLSDQLATVVSKTATALAAVETSLSDKATPAGLDMTSQLDMQGNAVVNVSTLRLTAGNFSQLAGAIFYYTGEFFAVDSTGLVQLTANGAINAAGVGGIVGDYGGVNPAKVTYDDASGEYRFTEDNAPTYADLRVQDVIYVQNGGGTGSLRITVDSAITTARLIALKSLPTSGKSLLVYDAAGSTLEDNAATRATNVVKVTNLDLSGNVIHPERTVGLSMTGARTLGTATATIEPYVATQDISGTFTWRQQIPIEVGKRVKSVTVLLNKLVAAATTLKIFRVTEAQIAAASAGTEMGTASTSATGVATLSCTANQNGAPVAAVATEQWYVQVSHTSENSTAFIAVPRFVHDQIA